MLRKLLKFVINNAFYLGLFSSIYFLILFNLVLSIIFAISSIYVKNIYRYKRHQFQKTRKLDFQINNFIKNMAINSLTNNFNIIDSIEKSITFVDGKLKKDLLELSAEIKLDFNYEKAFDHLATKYKNNRILKEFLVNILIIKEQSNVDQSAQRIFEIASKDSQKYIVTQDRVNRIKESNFKNYLINVFLGLFVMMLIAFSLNVYYYAYAQTLPGIIINSSTILLFLFMTIKFINKVYAGDGHEL